MSDIENLQALVDEAAARLGAASAILVVSDPRGFNAMSMSGLTSHKEAVLLLASATHMVLLGHDDAVLAGDAGEDRKRVAEALRT